MKLVAWMLAGSILSAIVLTMLPGVSTRREIWLGMLGPLISAVASWIVMERQHRLQPQGMTRLLIKAFAAKMIFFGIYIAFILIIELVRPIPFVISFAGYYIALHIVEAIGLRHLQTAGLHESSEMIRSQLRNG
jgi:hypothetical protein